MYMNLMFFKYFFISFSDVLENATTYVLHYFYRWRSEKLLRMIAVAKNGSRK